VADERWETIHAAIVELPDDARRILWLHEAQSLALREIADALEIDEPEAEAAYARAREHVRARLRAAGHEDLRWEPPLPRSLDQ
jgi:DNA-directed RNA polymerase specialized sigma24 family protein